MQANTFVDERMKVLYVLSFMCRGTAQVWVVNETMAVITGTSQKQTLDIFLESVKKIFGDLDQARTACAQLHELKMTPSTTAEDYTAQFEMLVGRTGFKDAALEDIYVQGLPNSILQKIFAQVTLPNGLAAWKMVVRNLLSQLPPPKPYGAEEIHRPDKPECRTHESNGWPGQTTGRHYHQSVHTHRA